MSLSLVFALFWLLLVNLDAIFVSADHHWRFTFVMIAVGVPILIGVLYEDGGWMALLVLISAAWLMRWSALHLARWIKRRVL
ncbi:DUF2484 family protein [Pseudopelagicola sp. nBUS_20]|uniref:DUF2484 family protein n=1 Tax=Pseudopelagicola sp. nBUS_20 TaxID=3395317 RepID=UPI003EBFEF3E